MDKFFKGCKNVAEMFIAEVIMWTSFSKARIMQRGIHNSHDNVYWFFKGYDNEEKEFIASMKM